MMGTRPQTIGYALTDSPVGLAAWIYDYNNGEPERLLDRDDVLDNITLYWLTNTATSAARLYWETSRPKRRSRGRAEDRRDLAPGRHHGVSGRGLSSPGDLGPARLSQPHLLQRGRQGRPLRRLGAAGALLCRRSARRSGRSANPDPQSPIPHTRRRHSMKTHRLFAAAALLVASELAAALWHSLTKQPGRHQAHQSAA